MKYLNFFSAVAILCMLQTGADAQKKLGHIDSNALLEAMPEKAEVDKKLEDHAKQLQAQLQTMTQEYQTKIAEYQQNSETWSDLIKSTKEAEITDLETRIQKFQADAQNNYAQEESKLLKPVVDKAKKAIEDVAKEHGYAYIFDTGVGAVLYYPESDNILELVKKKLGITAPPAGNQ